MGGGCAGWLGDFSAWKQQQQRECAEKHHAKEPGNIIVGQHRRLPMDQSIYQGKGLPLDRNRIACLGRQTRGQRCRIARVGGIHTTDRGAQMRVVDDGEPLQQGGDQRITEIASHTPRQRIEARLGRHVLPSDPTLTVDRYME